MKQKITKEQLNELSDKGKARLRAWWKPVYGNWISHQSKDCGCEGEELLFHFDNDEGGDVAGEDYDHRISDRESDTHITEYLPLLSIGQMIEFLLSNESKSGDIEANISYGFGINDVIVGWSANLELCDALWEACKNILNS